MPTSDKSPASSFLGFITAAYFCCFIGSEGAFQGISGWYLIIQRPAWAPGPILLEPLWLLLYGMAGVAIYQAFRQERAPKVAVIVISSVLLELSALWDWLFFAWHLLVPALILGILLWLTMLGWVGWLLKLRISAGLLALPLLCWFCYASALNMAVWRLNSGPQTAPTLVPSSPVP
jgi:translocator protein